MGATLNQKRIRLLMDADNWNAVLPNVLVSALPVAVLIPNGADLLFQLAAMASSVAPAPITDANKIDFTTVAKVTVSLMGTPDPRNTTIYWSYDVLNVNINNAMTAAHWLDGSDQQISLAIPGNVNGFAMTGANQVFWLCVYATTTDAIPKVIPLATFPVTVFDTGLPYVTINTGYTPSGNGSPQGVVTGYTGLTYWDNLNGAFYVNTSVPIGINWQKLIQL